MANGVSAIPVADAAELMGKRAAVTIPAGSLLVTADVTIAQPIAAGDAVVGLALKPGQLPSAGVESGDEVMVVQTASLGAPLNPPSVAAGGEASTGVLVPQALVFNVDAPPTDGASSASQLVSIELSSTLAATVSAAAAADQVSLVLLPALSPDSRPSGKGPTGDRKRASSAVGKGS